MESLENGPTPIRNVRIPDSLWQRLEEWAAKTGVGDAEALRELLRIGLETQPVAPVRPLHAWMRKQAPGQIFCTVPAGSDWWDLDSAVGELPGAQLAERGYSHDRWWRLPASELETVRAVFAHRPDRIRIHGE